MRFPCEIEIPLFTVNEIDIPHSTVNEIDIPHFAVKCDFLMT